MYKVTVYLGGAKEKVLDEKRGVATPAVVVVVVVV